MSVLYTTHATITAGREGNAKTDDGKIDVALSPPGSNGAGTNPEQLFAAGYGACFGEAVKAMAKRENLTPESVTIEADVQLHKDDSGFYISANLNALLPGLSQRDAEKLVGFAHEICPYSKATRGNIEVSLQANGASLKKAAA